MWTLMRTLLCMISHSAEWMKPIPPMSAASWYTSSATREPSATAARQFTSSRRSSTRNSSAADCENSGFLMSTRSEEHTSELQSRRDLHSFPTRRSSDLGTQRNRRAAIHLLPKVQHKKFIRGRLRELRFLDVNPAHPIAFAFEPLNKVAADEPAGTAYNCCFHVYRHNI